MNVHGLIDVSMYKNMKTFQGMTGAQRDAAATEIIRQQGINEMTRMYDTSDESRKIGAQAMQFVHLPKEYQKAHAEDVMQYVNWLMTPMGTREFLSTSSMPEARLYQEGI
jgi:hypothetical protein